MADPPKVVRGNRRRYDTPQKTICPNCGLLDGGPLSEKRMRFGFWEFLLGVGLGWLLVWLAFRLGGS